MMRAKHDGGSFIHAASLYRIQQRPWLAAAVGIGKQAAHCRLCIYAKLPRSFERMGDCWPCTKALDNDIGGVKMKRESWA